MPHRKASLLSCALCLNKHLSKHLDNHFSPHLNTHTYTLTRTYYTHLECSTTHGVVLVSGQCPKPWSSCCPMWLENKENYDINIPTWFIRRQCRAVSKWSTVLSNLFSINLSLSLNSSFLPRSLCSTWLWSPHVPTIIYGAIIYDGHLWVCLWPHFANHACKPIQQETGSKFSIMIGKNCNHTALTIFCPLEAKQHFTTFPKSSQVFMQMIAVALYDILTHTSHQALFFLLYYLHISGASDWESTWPEGAGG